MIVLLLLLSTPAQTTEAKQPERPATVAPAPTHTVATATTTEPARKETRKGPRTSKWWPEGTNFGEKVNFWLLIVTTLYLFATTLIWWTARRSLDLVLLDLRPWVTTGPFGEEGDVTKVDAGSKAFFSVDMINVGKTPAFVTLAGTHTNVYRELPHKAPTIEQGGCPILAPNDVRELRVIIPAMDKATLDEIGKSRHLVTFVIIEYRDSRGKAHRTISAHELVQFPGTSNFRWQDLLENGAMT